MSDPLASFAGLSLNSRGPKLLAFFADNKLVVNNHALEVLKGIKGPVAVLGMSGSARSGNSSLCNWLLQQQGLQPSFPFLSLHSFFVFSFAILYFILFFYFALYYSMFNWLLRRSGTLSDRK